MPEMIGLQINPTGHNYLELGLFGCLQNNFGIILQFYLRCKERVFFCIFG